MVRKFIVYAVLLALLLNLVAAQSDELFDFHALTLDFVISNNFSVVPTSTDSFLDYASADLSWYPREDYRQKTIYITTEPESKFSEDQGFLFEWRNPAQTNFLIAETAEINAKNEFVPITKKIDFPLKDLDPEYSQYLAPQEIIDINDKIRQTASQVVQGETDYYSAVFKIAEWVGDYVEYNLSSITAEAAQKASWVMDNRQGVCNEISSLFISMCRSLGIPARFVTGLSYSNVNLQNNGWGPHGWAEVYFPGTGWVPFDVTYKEMGYVDATHIKLKTSLDAKEISINYATKSRDTDIQPGQLQFDVNVTGNDYQVKPVVSMEAEVAEPQVGFGSYNLLIVTVKNLKDYYATTRIGLANVNDLEIMGDNFQAVVLGPGEEKKIYWMIQVSPDVPKGFIYTFPLKLTASFGEEAETSFKAAELGEDYSEEYMRTLMIAEQPETNSTTSYSNNVLLACSVGNDKIYLNESTNVNCTVQNNGSADLSKIQICLDKNCASGMVPSQGMAGYDYSERFDTFGIKTLVFRVFNELIDKSYYAIIDVQDKPLLEISNLTFPERINYNESSEIKFFVKKKSNSSPKNVKIVLEHELMHEEWNVPALEQDYEFRVLIKGENLYFGQNDFKIKITYQDEKGNPFGIYQNFSINLNNPTLLQKLRIWLNLLDYEISQWLSKI